MRLEDVTAEIRPRVPWESIDLGCALAREHIKAIWKSWFVTVVPLWIVLAVLLRDHPWWFLVILWWLKPVYDRVLLFVISRALFGAVPKVKDVLKAWPKLLVKNLWKSLIVRRFSPSRSLTMPVSELEGLKGKSYTQRVHLLEVNGGEGASVATLAGLLLEAVACVRVVLLVFSMVPSEISERWWFALSESASNDDFNYFGGSLLWTIAAIWMLAITLMEPFYVGAGFALYVNSRTLTEGWDIELAFKRMSTRISSLKNGVKKRAMLLLAMSGFFFAATENASAETTIDEIMQSEDFIIHTKIEKVPVEKSSSSKGWAMPTFMGVLGQVMFYIILAAAIGGLVYLIYRNRHLLGGMKSGGRIEPSAARTREVMGMDVTPESLPEDIVTAARGAWGSGDYQQALSLLYRGSIMWLVNRVDLPIEESDTEGDCLRHVNVMNDTAIVPYFKNLTQAWVSVAYGKNQPEDSTMENLFDAWPFHEKITKDRSVQ